MSTASSGRPTTCSTKDSGSHPKAWRAKPSFCSPVGVEWIIFYPLIQSKYHRAVGRQRDGGAPAEVSERQISIIYANEADVLNVALFGMTAKEWRDGNTGLKGNIRDYATINQLICLSNMESLNAILINEGLPQSERLRRLNAVAIQQMSVLEGDDINRKLLK